MKMACTRRDFILTLPLAVLATSLLFRFAPLGRARAEGNAIGHISRIKGLVTIMRDGEALTLGVGREIEVADTLRTGLDGRAEITFSDASVLTVGPDSEVAVSFFAPEAAQATALLDLISGIIRVTVNKATAWGRFEVRTTTAVASVRGTEYLVEALPDKSAVFVTEGRVAVSSRAGAGTVILRAGQGVDVPKDKVPLVVKTWGAKRRDAALARVTFP
jgi:hypothetical protein